MEEIILLSIQKRELEIIIEDCVRRVLEDVMPISGKANKEELLTVEEAGEFLRLSKPTIYAYISARKIPCFKKGKRIYFKKNVLFDWISEGKLKTTLEIKQEALNYLKRK